LALHAVACGDDDAPSVDAGADGAADAGLARAVAVFDLGALASGVVASVPYPSDLYRDGDGAIVLGDIPGVRNRPAFDALRRLLRGRSGFCTTAGVHFAIEGALDAASLPESASALGVASIDDPILLVDVDPSSPERGRLFPLRVHFFERANRIAVRPVPGLVLARNRRYAAVLTDRLRGADGDALGASDDFLAVRSGDDARPEVARARSVVMPALDALESLGLQRERVVSIASFTTGDASLELARVHALLAARPPPAFVVDRVRRGPELDELLGVPADAGPGIDGPPATGIEGTRAIAHETTALVVTGTFAAPRLVSGAGTDVGVPLRDAAGAIVLGDLEPVPFVLVVPAGADLTSLPVVISLHGFNASRVTGFVLADTAGRAGAAVLAIDYFQHGERAASATDALHAMRGDLAGADGFAETSPLDVSARVFGLAGVESGTELSPDYALGSVLQFAADAMSTVRLVRDGDAAALRDAAPELATLAFDPSRVFVVGNSLGAEVSTLLAAVERSIAGVVLNVLPGSIVDNLVESPEFRPITESIFLPALGLTGPFVEPARGLDLDLVIDLFRFALEPIDPLALAPHLLRDPVDPGAGAPDVLVQLGGLDEVASRRSGEAATAALGLPTAPALTLARTDLAALPAHENVVTTGGTAVTALGLLYDGGHGMMELRAQESRYVPPALPPFERRPTPITVANPIVEVHADIEALLRTRTPAARATLRE
jgi:acetyl esterase/lipase